MVKNPPASAVDTGDLDSIPGLGRSPGIGNGNPLQCSCLDNPMNKGAWPVRGSQGVGYDWDWAHTGRSLDDLCPFTKTADRTASNNCTLIVLHTLPYWWGTFLEMELLDQAACAFFYSDKYRASKEMPDKFCSPQRGVRVVRTFKSFVTEGCFYLITVSNLRFTCVMLVAFCLWHGLIFQHSWVLYIFLPAVWGHHLSLNRK